MRVNATVLTAVLLLPTFLGLPADATGDSGQLAGLSDVIVRSGDSICYSQTYPDEPTEWHASRDWMVSGTRTSIVFGGHGQNQTYYLKERTTTNEMRDLWTYNAKTETLTERASSYHDGSTDPILIRHVDTGFDSWYAEVDFTWPNQTGAHARSMYSFECKLSEPSNVFYPKSDSTPMGVYNFGRANPWELDDFAGYVDENNYDGGYWGYGVFFSEVGDDGLHGRADALDEPIYLVSTNLAASNANTSALWKDNDRSTGTRLDTATGFDRDSCHTDEFPNVWQDIFFVDSPAADPRNDPLNRDPRTIDDVFARFYVENERSMCVKVHVFSADLATLTYVGVIDAMNFPDGPFAWDRRIKLETPVYAGGVRLQLGGKMSDGQAITYRLNLTELEITGTPNAPGTPLVTSTNATPSTVALSWAAPADGGSPITSYVLKRDGSTLATLAASALGYTDEPPLRFTAYTYEVCAVNAAGSTCAQHVASSQPGTPSTPSIAATTASTPLSVDLTFSVAAFNDDAPHTSVVVKRNGTSIATLAGTATTYTDSGLPASVDYQYSVCAANRLHTTCSDTVSAMPDPDAPTKPVLSLTEAIGSVVLEWAPPSWDGGAAITGYTIRKEGSVYATLSAATTTYTDTAADVYQRDHEYVVCASNRARTTCSDPASGSSSVTAPGQAGVTTESKIEKVRLTLTAASNGHGTTDAAGFWYHVYMDGTFVANVTPATITSPWTTTYDVAMAANTSASIRVDTVNTYGTTTGVATTDDAYAQPQASAIKSIERFLSSTRVTFKNPVWSPLPIEDFSLEFQSHPGGSWTYIPAGTGSTSTQRFDSSASHATNCYRVGVKVDGAVYQYTERKCL